MVCEIDHQLVVMAVKEEEEGAAVVAMSIFLQGPGTGKWYQVVVDI